MWRLVRYDLPLHFVLLLTNWLPDNVMFIRLRGRLARPFFKSCGKKLGLGRNVTFYNPSKIEIGTDVYIAYGCWFLGAKSIVIEDEVLFGPYSLIAASNHTRLNDSFRFGEPLSSDVFIGKGAWVGGHSTLVVGARVGSGSMLAANSVLNKPMKDNVMYGGIPAKLIKEL
jgi:acetyltransferase-like isoleucine patch superfamily enzyme